MAEPTKYPQCWVWQLHRHPGTPGSRHSFSGREVARSIRGPGAMCGSSRGETRLNRQDIGADERKACRSREKMCNSTHSLVSPAARVQLEPALTLRGASVAGRCD